MWDSRDGEKCQMNKHVFCFSFLVSAELPRWSFFLFVSIFSCGLRFIDVAAGCFFFLSCVLGYIVSYCARQCENQNDNVLMDDHKKPTKKLKRSKQRTTAAKIQRRRFHHRNENFAFIQFFFWERNRCGSSFHF